MELLKIIRADFKLNSFRSALILFFHRFINHIYLKYSGLTSKFIIKILIIVWEVLKAFLNINCQISYKAKIGKNIRLPHIAVGVVISSKAIIGDNVTIFHQVTIGVKEDIEENMQNIIIGDNCYISTGAKIISCKLEDNVVVGPNAVVYKDVSSRTKVFANSVIK
jgi:serine O-acetyltransferase